MSIFELLCLKLYSLIYRVCRKLHLLPAMQFLNNPKHAIIKNYMVRTYSSILKKYENVVLTDADRQGIIPEAPIWVMWYQGEDAMPPIVKACYKNLKRRAGRHKINLITQENVREYTRQCPIWDDEIYNQISLKHINLTQFSDLFRMCVLHTFGGVWIDSTVWLNKDLDEIIDGQGFITRKLPNSTDTFFVPKGKWTAFFVGCNSGNMLTKCIYELLLASLKREQRFIDYFMIDYSFTVSYEQLSFVREIINAVAPIPYAASSVMSVINEPYVAEEFERIFGCGAPLFKFSYKEKLRPETKDGSLTNYGYILEQ